MKESIGKSIIAMLSSLSLLAFSSAMFDVQAATPSGDASAVLDKQAAPDATLRDFYGWYLQRLTQSEDPIRDQPATISKFVSNALIKEINSRINSPDGLEYDYFLHAQDYLDDWPNNILVSGLQIHGKKATAVVTLGGAQASRQRLSVTLVNEQSVWKIRRVAEVPAK